METKLTDVGKFVKGSGIKLEVSYGSGGFCIVIRDRDRKERSGYGWSIEEAFQAARDKFEYSSAEEFEEDTKVDIRKKK